MAFDEHNPKIERSFDSNEPEEEEDPDHQKVIEDINSNLDLLRRLGKPTHGFNNLRSRSRFSKTRLM